MSKESSSRVLCVKVDQMMLSMRSSGYDTSAAVGEPIDNSLQGKARQVNIQLVENTRVNTKGKRVKIVDQIAIVDDGIGMDKDVLHQCLVLGYSTRYDSRVGMGRFGVGATLAAISQCRRIDVYSRISAKAPWRHVHLDLDEVRDGLTDLDEPQPCEVPDLFYELMPSKNHGTLVVWSKCDRISEGDGGTVRDIDKVKSELIDWISRAYRHFLNSGRQIRLNGVLIEPHDPLYLMHTKRFEDDPKATPLVDETMEWQVPSDPSRSSNIRIKMTLLPDVWRLERGQGGSKFAKERRVDENGGLSIVRAEREIFFGILPGFFPRDRKASDYEADIDRWFGLELSFEPELDECFMVKNVKKGAQPVDLLYKALQNKIGPMVEQARIQVRATYQHTENHKKFDGRLHANAEQAARDFEKTAPRPRAGYDVTPEERKKVLEALIKKQVTRQGEAAESQIRERVFSSPYSIDDDRWPGRSFINISHLGENTIVKLNNGHPFFTKIYSKIVEASGRLGEPDKLNVRDLMEIAGVVQDGIDVLLLAYAKAEGMVQSPEETYGELREQWGMFLYSLLERL